MNPFNRRFLSTLLALTLAQVLAPVGRAKMSAWSDGQGANFKGEPAGILGPVAVFRTGAGKGRWVALRAFSPDECRRLHSELAQRPARAARLAEASSDATSELIGNVRQVRDGELVPADLAARPEPELLMILGGSHNDGAGWFMAGNLNQFYHRLQRVYPGLVEAVFLGTRHDSSQHRNIALHTGMPWLVSSLSDQGAMSTLNRYLPREGANVVLVSREGVPLLASGAGDAGEIRKFMDQVAQLLWTVSPANAAGWPDRLHYLKATRPVEFAGSSAGPLLVGDPLKPEVLRRYGVKRVEARLEANPEGRVVTARLTEGALVPAELVEPLGLALTNAIVAPAIKEGRPVAGTLDYLLEIPEADPLRETERDWLNRFGNPTLEIPEWLVLRPIQVSEQDFASTVVGETADGAVILSALEVNSGKISRKAQMSAFNSDWFGEAGAGSVRPKAGERQRIDEKTVLSWEKVRSVDGLVNMQTGLPKDYTVGYAWAEFESPRDTEAWLGLGSDDGVKIWLNGELVHDKWVRRPSRIDDEIVPLHLKPGANRILIKIQNATGDWSFIYRLRLPPEK
jgi:hypothetical protein